MRCSITKAKELGVVKSVEDIKLTNDERKIFKKELVYDEFEDHTTNTFAVVKVNKIDVQKMKVLIVFSNYIFDPVKRSFKSLVRITALVIVASKKFKRLLLRKQIARGEKCVEDLKQIDFPEPRFSMFSTQEQVSTQQNPNQTTKISADLLIQPSDIQVFVKVWKPDQRNSMLNITRGSITQMVVIFGTKQITGALKIGKTIKQSL